MVERPADVENGYSLSAPLVYHFGHKSVDANTQLYNQLVSQLAEVINMRSEANNKSMSVLLDVITSAPPRLPSFAMSVSVYQSIGLHISKTACPSFTK